MVNFAILHSIDDDRFKLDDVDYVAESIATRPGQLDDTERKTGLSLLQKAVKMGAVKCVKLLLEKGMDPHWIESGGSDALKIAVINNASTDIFAQLVARLNAEKRTQRLLVLYVEFLNYRHRQTSLTDRLDWVHSFGVSPSSIELNASFDNAELEMFTAFQQKCALLDDAKGLLDKPTASPRSVRRF